MRALIIGGGGFLGQHLAEHLLERMYEVSVYDLRFPEKSSINDLPVKKFVGSITDDFDSLHQSMIGQDIVFHCASPPYQLNDSELFHHVNVYGTKQVIKACRQAGVKCLVLTSSCSVLYAGHDLKNADESTPYAESYLDLYTETKMLQEKLVLQANDDQLITVAIRPHGIFGPRDYTVSEMVRKTEQGQMKSIIGNGNNIVDFTYVKNVTWGHILAAEKALERSEVRGQVYHITNDEPVHFWAFIGQIVHRLGYEVPKRKIPYWFVFGLAMVLQSVSQLMGLFGVKWMPFLTPLKVALAATHHYYSCNKAKVDLGYKPLVSLEDGLEISFKSLRK